MGLLERVNRSLAVSGPGRALAVPGRGRAAHAPLAFDDYASWFGFNGLDYPVLQTTLGSIDRERLPARNTGLLGSHQ